MSNPYRRQDARSRHIVHYVNELEKQQNRLEGTYLLYVGKDMLIQIFSFLSLKDIASVGASCKYLNEVAGDENCWKVYLLTLR